MTRGKPFAERKIHILEIGAGAMQKNDRRRFVAAVSEFDHVLTKAVDFDEAARRHMRPLDQTRSDKGDDGAGAQDDNDDRDRGHKLRAILTLMTVPRVPAQAEPA